MPKKFVGENSKAVVAKARKEAVRQEALEKKRKDEEDEYWKDDDKKANKKLQRKEEKDKKKQGQQQRKLESKELLMQETQQMQNLIKAPKPKLTRAMIEEEQQKRTTAARPRLKQEETEPLLEENVNRLMVEGEEARTVDEALAVLSVKEKEVDKHPEKRMKAAFTAFEEKNLPVLKANNPNLRLSQLKQMLKKDWMKSPENPLNQARLSSLQKAS